MHLLVLLLFGEDDEQQPTADAVARWEAGLRSVGNPNWTVEIFASADHMLMVGDRADGRNRPRAEGLFERIISWLLSPSLM